MIRRLVGVAGRVVGALLGTDVPDGTLRDWWDFDDAPQSYVECPPAFGCEHGRWQPVRVDASFWCGRTAATHPGVRCPVCGTVRDLLLTPDPRDPSETRS